MLNAEETARLDRFLEQLRKSIIEGSGSGGGSIEAGGVRVEVRFEPAEKAK